MGNPIRRLARVLASVALLSVALVFVKTTAASAGGTWSAPQSIDGGSQYLGSVSCPSASFCAAVDFNGNALTFNGTSWSAPENIDYGSFSPYLVSCPSASFCAAVSSLGDALIYNGTSWSAPKEIDSRTPFNVASVSCPSATFCVAVDQVGNALTYNGTSWSAPKEIDSVGTPNLDYVSCPSATFCVAVDQMGNALTYNGTAWSSPSDIDGSIPIFSVSCPSASFCAAVDYDGNAFTFNGSSWSVPSDVDGSNRIWSVSCPSASFCAAVDDDGNALTYTSTSAPPPPPKVILPTSGATLSGSTYLDASATDAKSVEFYLFGGSYGFTGKLLCTATQTIYGWLCPWNTTTVPNGSYVLVSEAFNAGGSSFSSGVSITVKNPPTTSVLTPKSGATLSGSTTLDASASNATNVEFRLLGGIYGYSGPVVCTAKLSLYGWLCAWNTTTVPNGSYILVSEAFNSDGSAFSPGVSIKVNN